MNALLWDVVRVTLFQTVGRLSLVVQMGPVYLTLFVTLILIAAILLLLCHMFRLKVKQNQNLERKNEQILTLHAELSHRVQNNLAYLSSLMRIQGRRLHLPEAKIAIKEAANRLQAMVMIHHRLFAQQQKTSIEMSSYLKELIDFLEQSYHRPDFTPTIVLDLEEVYLNSDTAIRIGLIANELVTNAFKYAFAHQNQPELYILLQKKGGRLYLEVGDNGMGLPTNYEWHQAKKMGLSLVNTLVLQLGGQWKLDRESGTHFHIYIPQPVQMA